MIEIFVTGCGPVSAIGIGKDAWLRGLNAGVSRITSPGLFSGDHPVVEIRDLQIEKILPSIKTYLDRAAEFTLAACQLALQDAGLTPDGYNRWRAGVVMGSEFGCLGTLQTFTHALQQKGARLANPLLFSHAYHNTPASLASIEFNLGGHHGAYAGTDAGRQALEGSIEALQMDRADVIVAVGVDAISEPLYRALIAEGTLGTDALGEGACALVLETANHAGYRGAAGVPLSDITADGTYLRSLLGRSFAAEPFFALAHKLFATNYS